MLTESDVREALRACYAPAGPYPQPLNIADLGIIEHIALSIDPEAPGSGIPGVPPRQTLTLTLIPASPDKDLQTQLHAQIANRLAGLPELSRADIHFATTLTWTPARITPQGRRLLNLDFPILNNLK